MVKSETPSSLSLTLHLHPRLILRSSSQQPPSTKKTSTSLKKVQWPSRAINKAKVSHPQRKERPHVNRNPISYRQTKIIHFKYEFVGQKRVTCCYSPQHCHSRFHPVRAICSHHHSRADRPGVISIFCWGATPLLKTTSQPRALLTHVMQSCSAGAWQCSCLRPKPPKTSLSLCLCLFVSRPPLTECRPLEMRKIFLAHVGVHQSQLSQGYHHLISFWKPQKPQHKVAQIRSLPVLWCSLL